MKDKKFIYRFGAGVMLVSVIYGTGKTVVKLRTLEAPAPEQNSSVVLSAEVSTLAQRPYIYLTDGKTIDPETAPVTQKYEDSTAKEFATISFEGEETPDINEFLSRFLCNACGKGCLLTSPSCLVGKKTQEKATVLYQEMYPEVEIVI